MTEEPAVRDVRATTPVNVPLRMAYNQWTQFEVFPRFMSGVVAVTQLDDTRLHFQTSVKGVKRDFDAAITRQRPDKSTAWASLDGPSNEGSAVFERASETETIVTVQLTWQPVTGLEIIGAVFGLDASQIRGDLERFKQLVEGRGQETGLWRSSVTRGGVHDDVVAVAGAKGIKRGNPEAPADGGEEADPRTPGEPAVEEG